MAKSKSTLTSRYVLIAFGCLFSFCVLAAVLPPDDKPRKPSDERVHLIHADVLYKKHADDPRADVLVGHVKLYHEGMYLDCDSARFYQDDNTFHAYGHVKMIQGDTLTLTSDTLLYEGVELQAHAIGNSVLTHRKTRLVTANIDYDRMYGVGMYKQFGTLYDGDNVLTSDYGQYTPSTHEAEFNNNVVLVNNKKDTLLTNQLYYYTDVKRARIVSESNIISSDGTLIVGERGDYDTRTGEANLLDRSTVYKDMREIVGDSLYANKEKSYYEAHGNVRLTDLENFCMLTGDFCSYNHDTGIAVATDSAVAYEYSQQDTLYVHGDTLKMYSYNINTDSAYHDLYAYHKVRMYRVDVQGVCDSMVTHELDSCTYMYGQPILWNEQQQVFGEEIHIYNNDSTIDWIHVVNQAMTIEKLDSASFNQVSSKEMFSYIENGQIARNEAKGNVYVAYFMDEDDGTRIGMDYTETTELKMYMDNKKVKKIWMPAATGTIYPITEIPTEKRFLNNFAWFDYIRPVDKDDIFRWRSKNQEDLLKKTETKKVPLQKLKDIVK